MALAGYYSSIPWEKRLLAEHVTKDINGQIRKSGKAIKHSISSQTREIVAGNQALAQTFGKGFDALNNTLEFGLSDISYAVNDVRYAVEEVRDSIEGLRADFNYGIALLLSQLQVQNKILLGILDKLDAINKTLKNPTLTQAREFYRIGCDRLIKGLLDKALEAFLRAREKNDADFFTEYQIGKLYLYGIDEDDNVVNPQKAEAHLRDAFRYGKAELARETGLKSLAAETALHTSIACYAQATELNIADKKDKAKQKLKDACRWAKQSLNISPALLESSYHLSKYSALLGDDQTALLQQGKQLLDRGTYLDYLDFLRLDLLGQGRKIITKIWHSGDWSLLRTLKGHSDYVQSVCFSPGGGILASGSRDKTVKLWERKLDECMPLKEYELLKEQEAEAKRKAEEIRQANELRIKQKQKQEHRLRDRLCLACGQKLGFFDKMAKRTSHKSC